ncbi:MAG TPA: ribosome maturation factor RimM [Flavilitoribacter sp.]|nr:ribosome maturation factor RimM [Flavilitoribacter sp.]HMQ87075.1 ribosome maturation factor RimM [Flavilitoribacter sp.]
MEGWVEIGKTGKTHGLKGELKLQVDDFFLEDLFGAKAMFLDIRGRKTPYFIEAIRGGGAIIVKLEEVNSLEEAAALTQKPVFLRESDVAELPDPEDEGLEYGFLAGFALYSPIGENLGAIESIEAYPHQEIAVVRSRDKREVLIPLTEQFIVEIREKEKVVVMDLPEGLMEM